MRRSAIFLSKLSLVEKSCKILNRDFVTVTIPSRHWKTCGRTQTSFFSTEKTLNFQNNSSSNGNNLGEEFPNVYSIQRNIAENNDIDEDFESATTTEEILELFQATESYCEANERRLGLACLKIGQLLEQEGTEPEKILSFGLRALKILNTDGNESLPVAVALYMVGSASYSLKMYSESLEYLNMAERLLTRFEKDDCSDFDVKSVIHGVHLHLANTKKAMGRKKEALINLRKCLELQHTISAPNGGVLYTVYKDLAEAYVGILDFKEALPLCLKALDILKDQSGDNSIELANDRLFLANIYCGLGESQKALEQNELSRKVFKKWGLNSDLMNAEIDTANIQIESEKYEDAIRILKSVSLRSDKDSLTRGMVFIAMSKALCHQHKFADAKRCMEIACGILEKKESECPTKIGQSFMEIALLYETMSEIESAISFLKKALSVLEKIPQEQYAVGSVNGRIGWLLLFSDKALEAIPYLKIALEKLKESFGPKHFSLGYAYNNLGLAYMEIERPELAAEMFIIAKEIMDETLGPNDMESIGACQNLANACGTMRSYDLAMDLQQGVIDAWEKRGPSAKDELLDAHRLLYQLKQKKSRAEASKTFEENQLPDSLKDMIKIAREVGAI